MINKDIIFCISVINFLIVFDFVCTFIYYKLCMRFLRYKLYRYYKKRFKYFSLCYKNFYEANFDEEDEELREAIQEYLKNEAYNILNNGELYIKKGYCNKEENIREIMEHVKKMLITYQY